MTTSGSYFVSKLGWQEGWENGCNKITLLDRSQDFTNKDYWELSKVFKNNPQSQLFEVMQRMFLSAPDEGYAGGRYNKFRKSIGKFWVDFSKNRCQPNFEEDFLGKPCSYFLNVFGIETQNQDTPAEIITADTPLSLSRSTADQQEVSTRVSISLSHKNMLDKNMRLRMKCQNQEEKLVHPRFIQGSKSCQDK